MLAPSSLCKRFRVLEPSEVVIVRVILSLAWEDLLGVRKVRVWIGSLQGEDVVCLGFLV